MAQRLRQLGDRKFPLNRPIKIEMISPLRVTSFVTAVFSALILATSAAGVTIIDTSPVALYATNDGWAGSGQSFTVTSDNVFDYFTFYADTAAEGQLFDIRVMDALNGGSALFSSTDYAVTAGANTVTINQAFTSGSTIFVQIDYNGYMGLSLQFFDADLYAGGNSSFENDGVFQSISSLDHRFVAQFSGGSVPDTASTLALLGGTFVGLAALRRRFMCLGAIRS